VYDGRVYIGVGQDPEHGAGVGHLWCIDTTKEGDVSGDLVVDEGQSAPRTRPNPTSAVVWHFGGPDKADRRGYAFGRTLSTCAVHDGLLYAADLDGYIYCLDAKTGQKYWEHDTEAPCWSSPYWVDGKVYLGNLDGDVYVFRHGRARSLLAKVEMGNPIRSALVAAHGVLYVKTDDCLYAIAESR
jgi:outer membrane protein assembly factor BamB